MSLCGFLSLVTVGGPRGRGPENNLCTLSNDVCNRSDWSDTGNLMIEYNSSLLQYFILSLMYVRRCTVHKLTIATLADNKSVASYCEPGLREIERECMCVRARDRDIYAVNLVAKCCERAQVCNTVMECGYEKRTREWSPSNHCSSSN